MNQKYPEGIDQAEGCTSVPTLMKKDDVEERKHNQLLARRREMAAQYGFIDTKEVAMEKQKKLYLENKNHAENLENIKLERVNMNKNQRRDKKIKQEKQNVKFHSHVAVGGGNAAAAAAASSGRATINVNSLIGCKSGQSIGDKLLADGKIKHGTGRKGLKFG